VARRRLPRDFLSNFAYESRIEMLRRTSQFAAVLLIMAVAAMPVIACVVPERQMTAEEQSCCKKMANDCESSAMPASHSCCQHPGARHTANITGIRTGDISLCLASLVETPFSPVIPIGGNANPFGSLPESPPKISTILRI
jgi:hypothetical protein